MFEQPLYTTSEVIYPKLNTDNDQQLKAAMTAILVAILAVGISRSTFYSSSLHTGFLDVWVIAYVIFGSATSSYSTLILTIDLFSCILVPCIQTLPLQKSVQEVPPSDWTPEDSLEND